MKNVFLSFIALFITMGVCQANAILPLNMDEDQSIPVRFVKGPISQFYLDHAHTQRTWNNEKLRPGRYRYTVVTRKNNEKKGKVNFDVKVKFSNGSSSQRVNKVINPGATASGVFNVSDYRTNGQPAGYGMIKVHIGRRAHNTNVNYSINIQRIGDLPGQGGAGNNCTYTNLGNKTGNVIGNTVGSYTANKKACKNRATVTVTKTGGKARTTILVYTRPTRNGPKQLVPGTVEFPKNSGNSSRTITVNNANQKYIHVEVKNRSATKQFRYNLRITQ